jgi:hypothetical protein
VSARRVERQPRTRKPEPPRTPFSYDEISEKDGYSLDITGAEGMGKSHVARTFEGGFAWADTENKADPILKKFRDVYHDTKVVKLKRIKTFDDIRQLVEGAVIDPDISTIVIDSGTHLRPLAAEEWCKENGKDAVYPPTNYAYVNRKIDKVFNLAKDSGKYLVITNRLKDEWIGETTTGRMIRAGYTAFTYDLHLVMQIVWGLTDPKTGRTYFPEYKFARVDKNAFWGIDEQTNLNFAKPYLFEVSFEGIKKELLEPWGKGVPVGKEFETLMEEAKAIVEGKKK